MKISLKIQNLNELDTFSRILRKFLRLNDTILLTGEIGSGKTTFVKSLVKAFGLDDKIVSSPSFVLIHEYETTQGKIIHVDLYRLGENTSSSDIGLDDFYYDNCIKLIEWANYLQDPDEDALNIHFEIPLYMENTRIITLSSSSKLWIDRLVQVKVELDNSGLSLMHA